MQRQESRWRSIWQRISWRIVTVPSRVGEGEGEGEGEGLV